MLETDLIKQDQYSRCNNLDIQGVPDSVPDDQLKEKVIKIIVKINTFDIKGCHRMGNSKKTTIVHLVNRKNCKAVLEKKLSLNRK